MAPRERSTKALPDPRWSAKPRELPTELWATVLECGMKPKDLPRLRLVSRSFLFALQLAGPWTKARLLMYGSACPGPPTGMTEFEYVKLLVRKYCQVPGCNAKTSRIYWALKMHLCSKCFKKKSCTEFKTMWMIQNSPRTVDLLFHFWSKLWGNISCTGSNGSSIDGQLYYHLDAVSEALKLVRGLGAMPRTEKDEWFDAQKATRDTTLAQLQQRETFFKGFDGERKHEAKILKDEAKTLEDEIISCFANMALDMTPPLELGVLRFCPSFKKAIAKASKVGKEVAWQAAIPKVVAERDLAFRLESRFKQFMNLHPGFQMFLRSIDVGTEANRRTMKPGLLAGLHRAPQHEVKLLRCSKDVAVSEAQWRKNCKLDDTIFSTLRAITDKVLSNLAISVAGSNEIADQDIIPLVLREVYCCYQHELRCNRPWFAVRGPQLTMEDAGIVVNEVIQKTVEEWEDEQRAQTVTSRLKCLPCSRKGGRGLGTRRYTFQGLMDHMAWSHVLLGGELIDWPGLSESFSGWHELDWPPNLPILADHQRPTKTWEPEVMCEYERAPVAGSPLPALLAQAQLPPGLDL